MRLRRRSSFQEQRPMSQRPQPGDEVDLDPEDDPDHHLEEALDAYLMFGIGQDEDC